MTEYRDSEHPRGRRCEDYGMRGWLRDWSFVIALILGGVAFGTVEMQVQAGQEERKELKDAVKILMELQRQSAEQRGKLIEGQETLKQQGRLIQERLWEIKKQNGERHRRPPQ